MQPEASQPNASQRVVRRSGQVPKSALTIDEHNRLLETAKADVERRKAHRASMGPADVTAWEEALERLPKEGVPSVELLYEVATDLRRSGGYWGTFGFIEHLMAWLHYKGKCVYCDVDLVKDGLVASRIAATDHIIPKALRPDLERDWLNAAPACIPCNGMKASADPRPVLRSEVMGDVAG